MAARDPEEEFEFLVNLLASDEVESDSAPAGSQTGTSGLAGIQRGPDGKLDLGQVKAFYERKSGCSRDRSGDNGSRKEDVEDGSRSSGQTKSVSRCISDGGDQSVSPSNEQEETAAQNGAGFEWRTRRSGSPSREDSKRWVDQTSEEEAKRVLVEISDALGLKLPPSGEDPRSATDRPCTLADVRSVVEFLVKMDELVWRRSEHGADHGVFDQRNVSAVEERVRLWERIARGPCS